MRLFIGIDLPAELKNALLKFQSELKDSGVKGTWKYPENFHITLEFLGELEPQALSIITEVLSEQVKMHKCFKLTISNLGAFPSFQRPHTLWTGIGGDLSSLFQLRTEIHKELAQKGFSLEDRKFKPHITLASRPKLEEIDLSIFKILELGEFVVKEIVLFESKVIRGRRSYLNLRGLYLRS